jgi:hypothetical protein
MFINYYFYNCYENIFFFSDFENYNEFSILIFFLNSELALLQEYLILYEI